MQPAAFLKLISKLQQTQCRLTSLLKLFDLSNKSLITAVNHKVSPIPGSTRAANGLEAASASVIW